MFTPVRKAYNVEAEVFRTMGNYAFATVRGAPRMMRGAILSVADPFFGREV